MEGMYKNAFINSKNLDFSFFINLAIQAEISWNELENILEDLTPTLDKSKELNKVFLKELKIIQSQKKSLDFDTKTNELAKQSEDEEYEEFDSETVENEPNDDDGNEDQNETSNESTEIDENSEKDKGQNEPSNDSSEFEENHEMEPNYSDSEIDFIEPDDEESQEDEVTDNESSEFDQNCNICDRRFLNSVAFKNHYATDHNQVDSPKVENEIPSNHVEKSDVPIAEDDNPIKDSNVQSKENEDDSVELGTDTIVKVENSLSMVYVYGASELESDYPKSTKIEKDEHSISEEDIKPKIEDLGSNQKVKKASVKCETCDKSFRDKNTLEVHERSHTGDRPFKCKTCLKRFLVLYHLKRHEAVVHSKGNIPFECQFCKKPFYDRRDMTRHERIHSKEKPYQCSSCKTSFTSFNSLQIHTLIHRGKERFSCEVCYKGFSRKSHLERHNSIHKNKKSKVKEEIPDHLKNVTKDPKSEVLTLEKDKEAVQQSLHVEKNSYRCQFCNKKFKVQRYFNAHQRFHKHQPLKCEICSKVFGSNANLKRHELSCSNENLKLQCHFCKLTFKGSYNDLQKHQLIHSGKYPYECNVCKVKFKQLAHLKSHESLHSGENQFQCNSCDKSFARKVDLRSHNEISHLNEKQFECDICELEYPTENSLKTHKALHKELKLLGENPIHECKTCLKTFSRKSGLERHQKIHIT